MTTIRVPNCWICGRSISLEDFEVDKNGCATHEACYVAKVALEKGQSQSSTVAKVALKKEPSQASTPPKARLWANDQGQDIAEYAVILAVILDFWSHNTADPFQRQYCLLTCCKFHSVAAFCSQRLPSYSKAAARANPEGKRAEGRK